MAGVVEPGDHEGYMRLALNIARHSPLKPTNYRVGALVVDIEENRVIADGFTLELPGNTHAEQCCFMKLAEEYIVAESDLHTVLPRSLVLYTTMEPCSERLSGNLPCVERVRRLVGHIKTVYIGVREPDTFVNNTARRLLQEADIDVVHVPGLEDEILAVATAGHRPTQVNGDGVYMNGVSDGAHVNGLSHTGHVGSGDDNETVDENEDVPANNEQRNQSHRLPTLFRPQEVIIYANGNPERPCSASSNGMSQD